jgi:hypothetical protein
MPSAPGCSRRSEVGSHLERSEARRCYSTVEAVTDQLGPTLRWATATTTTRATSSQHR